MNKTHRPYSWPPAPAPKIGQVLSRVRDSLDATTITFAEFDRSMRRMRFAWVAYAALVMRDRGVPFEEALRRILNTRERFTHLRPQ